MIKLNYDNLKLLSEILNARHYSSAIIQKVKSSGGLIEDDSIIDQIMDALSEEMSEKGMSGDEPNQYGRQIDEIIGYYSSIQVSKK